MTMQSGSGDETAVEREQGGLERKMETRHLTMISLGGVIGTGLFLSSGYTIHQAGPLGAIIAYGIGSVLVYFIMLSLGDLSVAMPVDATVVSAFSRLGMVGHVHRGRLVAQRTVGTVVW